jgi:hypothetical protein
MISQERLDRPEAEDVVGDLGGEAPALVPGERGLLLLEGAQQQLTHLGLELLGGELGVVEPRPEHLDQRAVHLLAQLRQGVRADAVGAAAARLLHRRLQAAVDPGAGEALVERGGGHRLRLLRAAGRAAWPGPAGRVGRWSSVRSSRS